MASVVEVGCPWTVFAGWAGWSIYNFHIKKNSESLDLQGGQDSRVSNSYGRFLLFSKRYLWAFVLEMNFFGINVRRTYNKLLGLMILILP